VKTNQYRTLISRPCRNGVCLLFHKHDLVVAVVRLGLKTKVAQDIGFGLLDRLGDLLHLGQELCDHKVSMARNTAIIMNMGLLVSTDRFDSAGLQGEDGDQMEFRRHFGGWTIYQMQAVRWCRESGGCIKGHFWKYRTGFLYHPSGTTYNPQVADVSAAFKAICI
jgi:hypothetical protein